MKKSILISLVLVISKFAFADAVNDYRCTYTTPANQTLVSLMSVTGTGQNAKIDFTLWDGVTKGNLAYGEDGSKLPAGLLPAAANQANYDVMTGTATGADGSTERVALLVSKTIVENTAGAMDFWATLGEEGQWVSFACIEASGQ